MSIMQSSGSGNKLARMYTICFKGDMFITYVFMILENKLLC